MQHELPSTRLKAEVKYKSKAQAKQAGSVF